MANFLRCSCPICSGAPTDTVFTCTGQADAAATVSGATASAPKPIWTADQIAQNLTRSGTSWSSSLGTGAVITFGFRTVKPTTGVEAAGFSAFSNIQKAAARLALQTWADAANVRFVEADPSTAKIVFANTTSGPGQAWAYYPGAGVGGDVWINPNQASNLQTSPGGYGLLTLIHEIGHTLGLSHPGDYDASLGVPTYANDAQYAQDSRQYTDMSYFGASSTGANHGSSFASTALLHDVLAVQRLYGANTTVRNTDTVYGYGSTAGLPAYDFNTNRSPIVTIIDAGGTDTLNLSGTSVAARLDLREGAFSDVLGLTNNISIAYGTVIENAIGGNGSDTITGNDVANVLNGGAGNDILTGGLGNDTLIGGAGMDTACYSGPISSYSVMCISAGIYQVSGPDGTDRLDGIEYLRFGATQAVLIDSVASAVVLSVAVSPVSQAEGNSGTTPFIFTITRSGLATQTASAAWTVAGVGTNAASASDFLRSELPSGTVTFAVGETTKTISVWVQGDTLVEPDETFALTLSAPSTGVSIGAASATATILNDDIAPSLLSIAASSVSVNEGNSGTTPYAFIVSRSGNLNTAASATWSVAGTGAYAADAADFTGNSLPSGTVSFAAGETSKVITVNIAGDQTVERDETFVVTLGGAGANTAFATASAVGIISNDDSASAVLSIAASVAARPEGNSGASPYAFIVTRSGNTATAASATWRVSGSGTNQATATDFQGNILPSGTVSFAAGETSKTINISIAGDTVVEKDESFAVTLAPASNTTTVATASAVGTILNDDQPAATLSLQATGLTRTEGSNGSAMFSFNVVRSGTTTGNASAVWRVSGSGTNAATASDFVGNALPGGVVSFMSGETSRTVSFLVNSDKVAEANETFTVSLSSPSSNAVIGTASVAGQIVNDDLARVGSQLLASGIELYGAVDRSGRLQLFATDTVSTRQLTAGVAPQGTAPRQFITLDNGRTLFTGNDNAGRTQLFATDGFSATQLTVASAFTGLQPRDFEPTFGGRELFVGLDGFGRAQLWSTDGRSATMLTTVSGGLNPTGFVSLSDGRDRFMGMDSSQQMRTWVTDGTASGTSVIG